jgi:glycosyltransferase involved in cell wall biosynthesis
VTKPLKISVVTAVYNVEDYINETMKSIHGQDYENLGVL